MPTLQKKGNVVDMRGRPQTPNESRQQVLERLFREHGPALRAFLTVRMGGNNDLEDIIQEVFVRLSRLDNLQERLPVGNDSNRSFLFAVANNLMVDLERARRVRREYVEVQQASISEEDEACDSTPESEALANEQLDKVKQAILKLKPAWRTAFILSRFMHKSYREIAIEMGVSVKQVEWFVKCALAHIQKISVHIPGRTRGSMGGDKR